MSGQGMIGVAVTGAAGRMGRRLVAGVAGDPGLELSGATETKGHPDLGRDAGTMAGVGELGVPVRESLEPLLDSAQAVIDFTGPEPTLEHLALCAAKGVPMIIGTTGLSPEQREKALELAAPIPCVMAPNMSVGVNFLFHMVGEAAKILGDGFDIEIVEAHHRLKKDAPSGTAMRLLEVAAEGRGWQVKDAARFCREGMIGQRPDREIGVQTIRAGDIVGDHTVIFAGAGERIELTHRAHSRDTFAAGAVRAVHWVAKKAPGMYDMQDVLGLRGGCG